MGMLALKRLMSPRQRERRRRRKVHARNGSIPSMPKSKKDNSRCGKRLRDSEPSLPAGIMGMPVLKRLKTTQQQERRQRRRLKLQARNRSITPTSKTKKGNSQRGKRLRYSGPNLPEDIWCHIHSLLPMRDSARAACVSLAFRRSWKRHPNLILTKEMLGLKKDACGKGDIARAFTSKVDQILKNHSGTGVKTLELDIFDCRDLDTCYLNTWLQIAITPGIENLTLWLPSKYREGYTFPCSLLFGGNGSSIQHLQLSCCAFDPTVGIGCLRSLTNLDLDDVCITGEQLGCLLSKSFALKKLELTLCNEIICLKIPCVLEQLTCLTLSDCRMLQMIESKAPNLSTIIFDGDLVQLSLRQSLQVQDLHMECFHEANFLCYAISTLPYIVPNIKTLTLSSISESINKPMVAAKFLNLQYLEIYLKGDLPPGYDYLSLVAFLDASPVLETFIFGVRQGDMVFDSVFGDASHMRQMSEHRHDSLKDVAIYGFCSSKSMVELACHILESATSLERITLDSVFDQNDEDDIGRCSVNPGRKAGKCSSLTNQMIMEANRGLMAIKRYIEGKVPSTVKLDVRGPCSRCHTLEL